MTNSETICQLRIDNAVLKERIKRLEAIVYGVIAFASLQLVGLFIMWAYNVVNAK